MADTRLLLNGFSIIGDPQTNSNASNGGEFLIHNGTEVFERNDIVVFLVEGATDDGVLTDDSLIVGVIVYDNASDYFNDIPKYTYNAPPGSGGDIEFGRNTMGDRYLEFDASPLTSTDAGAPVLDELALVAGVDILGTLATTNGPLEIPTNEDIDLDGDGVIDPDEVADGSFESDLEVLTIICFARGTLIETPTGPQYIETLQEGDWITTLDNGPQRLKWIGSRVCSAMGKHAPIRIRRGALGNIRDLYVSPNHRMMLTGARAELLFGQSEVLVAAKHLVNDDTIREVRRTDIEYFHLLFDEHQVVFAEGCPAESLFPGRQALDAVTDDARAEILELFPELENADCTGDLSRYALKKHEAALMVGAA